MANLQVEEILYSSFSASTSLVWSVTGRKSEARQEGTAQNLPEPGLRPDMGRGCSPLEAALASSLLTLPVSLPPPSPLFNLAVKAAGGTNGLARGSGLAKPGGSDLNSPLSLE